MGSEMDKFVEDSTEYDIKQKIVEELLDREKNLESKTELDKPLRWSALESIRDYLDQKGLKMSATILAKFQRTSFTYLISNKRKGREEYIAALKALGNLENLPNSVNPLNPMAK